MTSPSRAAHSFCHQPGCRGLSSSRSVRSTKDVPYWNASPCLRTLVHLMMRVFVVPPGCFSSRNVNLNGVHQSTRWVMMSLTKKDLPLDICQRPIGAAVTPPHTLASSLRICKPSLLSLHRHTRGMLTRFTSVGATSRCHVIDRHL